MKYEQEDIVGKYVNCSAVCPNSQQTAEVAGTAQKAYVGRKS